MANNLKISDLDIIILEKIKPNITSSTCTFLKIKISATSLRNKHLTTTKKTQIKILRKLRKDTAVVHRLLARANQYISRN